MAIASLILADHNVIESPQFTRSLFAILPIERSRLANGLCPIALHRQETGLAILFGAGVILQFLLLLLPTEQIPNGPLFAVLRVLTTTVLT